MMNHNYSTVKIPVRIFNPTGIKLYNYFILRFVLKKINEIHQIKMLHKPFLEMDQADFKIISAHPYLNTLDIEH